jgi:hypothetical protein
MNPKRNVSEAAAGSAAAPARAKKPATTTHSRRSKAVAAPETAAAPVIPTPESVEPEMAMAQEATYEEIAALAYSYWEARGYQGGSPEEDWHRAEQELRRRS